MPSSEHDELAYTILLHARSQCKTSELRVNIQLVASEYMTILDMDKYTVASLQYDILRAVAEMTFPVLGPKLPKLNLHLRAPREDEETFNTKAVRRALLDHALSAEDLLLSVMSNGTDSPLAGRAVPPPAEEEMRAVPLPAEGEMRGLKRSASEVEEEEEEEGRQNGNKRVKRHNKPANMSWEEYREWEEDIEADIEFFRMYELDHEDEGEGEGEDKKPIIIESDDEEDIKPISIKSDDDGVTKPIIESDDIEETEADIELFRMYELELENEDEDKKPIIIIESDEDEDIKPIIIESDDEEDIKPIIIKIEDEDDEEETKPLFPISDNQGQGQGQSGAKGPKKNPKPAHMSWAGFEDWEPADDQDFDQENAFYWELSPPVDEEAYCLRNILRHCREERQKALERGIVKVEEDE
ncbi:hypothetical protein GGS20DRAFT_583322 [Poronia punctata]|nr:hypothetical protein GGS20DRAFT_583322 [Poronia punctata]